MKLLRSFASRRAATHSGSLASAVLSPVPSFASQLKRTREDLGLSQSQAAARVPFLPVKTLQGWEQGCNVPPVWAQNLVLVQIAKQPAYLSKAVTHETH